MMQVKNKLHFLSFFFLISLGFLLIKITKNIINIKIILFIKNPFGKGFLFNHTYLSK
ncbi:hypothetical protein PAWBP_7750 [Paulownia witches'-broom phytoplasma]|nr:hypothetical protein PAWBP_7750 [Paulownia witches'-broom phytoplasma]